MIGHLRRRSQDAGQSWRKWEHPVARRERRRLAYLTALKVGLFWLYCFDVGAWAAYIAHANGLLA